MAEPVNGPPWSLASPASLGCGPGLSREFVGSGIQAPLTGTEEEMCEQSNHPEAMDL